MRVALLTLLLLASAPAAERPHVVFILADDLGIGDLSCYNPDSKIPTPAMNRLAAQGMRFSDVHTPSSVCTPTRYGFLTGRYAWRGALKKGVLNGYSPALIEAGRPTVASYLKSKGYRTGAVGKWHLGLGSAPKTDYGKPLDPGPISAGFDEFEGIPASLDMEPYVWVKDRAAEALPTETTPGSKHQRDGGEGFWRGGPIAPGFKHVDTLPRVEKAAIAFLERQTKDQPFFLYLPLTAPHTPWVPTAEFASKSRVGAYGDFVMQTDAVIGHILEAIDRLGFAKQTLVVLTSDNGSHWPEGDIARWGHRANGPWRGQKADIHEGGHRVPFIVRGPGVKEGSRSDGTACLVDAFATVCDLLGEASPREGAEDSFSLMPLLRGEPEKFTRAPVIHHSSNGMFAIRSGSLKWIEGKGSGGFTKVATMPDDPPGQLYDLAQDPAEARNLYADKPADVARLAAALQEARARGRTRP